MSSTRKASGTRSSHASSGSPRRSRQAPFIRVDHDLCKSCGICSRLCPRDVFDTDGHGRPLVSRPGDCSRCGFCEQHCPDFAIEVLEPDAAAAAADREEAETEPLTTALDAEAAPGAAAVEQPAGDEADAG
jgi:2-oxoglutarate ferredoxin oxidoreductase subunit delta